MNIVTIDYTNIPVLQTSAACIGFFDGMHKGHQELLKKALTISKKNHIESAVITFAPDPWAIFYPEKQLHHLFTLQDKIHFAEYMGFDSFYTIRFTKELAAQSIDSFHSILQQMNISTLVCGFDFRYAHQNKGNIHTLMEQSYFDVCVIDSVNDRSIKISSSRIEPLIQTGQIMKANRLLGYLYSIEGIIGYGFQRGSKILGIPTANLNVDHEYVLPVVGVYSGLVSVDDQMYGAMINIGNNPTFENKIQTIEANLFDFDQNIYDQHVRFFFYDKIRDEQKFSSAKELKKQLLMDIETSKKKLSGNRSLIKKTAEIWNKKLFYD